MGILSRISKVLESNLNSMLERAEDPEKMLDQAIEDLKKGREEARQAIVQAKTELRLAEKRRDKALAEAADLERKAMQALKLDKEDLARKLVEQKLSTSEKAEAENVSIRANEGQIQELQAAEKELDRRIREMPGKRAGLLARKAVAEAKGARTGAVSKTQDRVANALDAIDRMEEKIIRAEVDAEVRTEMDGGMAASELRMLEDGRADQELEALKAKMAQLPAGKTEDAPVPAPAENVSDSAVDDSLAALKAKLDKGE